MFLWKPLQTLRHCRTLKPEEVHSVRHANEDCEGRKSGQSSPEVHCHPHSGSAPGGSDPTKGPADSFL